MRKTRSDKGKTHKKKKWSFKVTIKKQITNLNNTIKKIGKNYYKQEVERLKGVNPSWSKKQIREEAARRQEGYEKIITTEYSLVNQFMNDLKDYKVDEDTGKYIAQFINMDIGVGGFSISSYNNFNIELLARFAEKAGGYDKIKSVTLGLSPEELELFKYFINSRDNGDEKYFFYEYLPNVDNATLVQDIMEFMNVNNISNEMVNRLEM